MVEVIMWRELMKGLNLGAKPEHIKQKSSVNLDDTPNPILVLRLIRFLGIISGHIMSVMRNRNIHMNYERIR